MKCEKKIIFPSISNLHYFLREDKEIINCICYENKYVFCVETDEIRSQYKSIRIWKTNSIFDIWYDNMNSKNFVAALDYNICGDEDDIIKIYYLNLNDSEMKNSNPLSNSRLNNEESKELLESLIQYLENYGRKNGKTKIVIDVHENLHIFKNLSLQFWFISTGKRCKDNPYLLEANKKIF